MHGQRSAAARVDETGEASTPPPRRLRRHPSSREEGKADHLAAYGGTPPQERRGRPSAAFCLAMSSTIPCIASASSASICAAENGAPSAAPCTSTKPPEPVITT